MTYKNTRSITAALAVATTTLFVGCAGAPERPVEELTRARTLINQAEQAGGQQYAAAEMKRAREKLQQADKAAEAGEKSASELAVEAAADAELAAAKVRQAKAEEAASEVTRSVESLRKESNRQPPKQ